MPAQRVFAMPDLGEGLEEGEITAWLVAEGDTVALNQPIVEVETAKATVEIPSPFAGVVARLHGAVGDAIPVGQPLVTFDVAADEPGGGVKATPPVRKLARSLGIDITTVEGTGPERRITAEDVQRVADRITAAPEGAAAVTRHQELRGTSNPVTPTRRAIAENLSRQVAIPQVTTFRTVDCAALEHFRSERRASPLPVVIASLCRIVVSHPLLNARWIDDAIVSYATVNVGLAIDTDRGLMVPVLQDAGAWGIGDLTAEIGRLATSARAGTIGVEDIAPSATIAVSNTGSYGSEAGTPILSPGTAVTLAIGVIEPRALVVDGAVVARPACTLSCTFDHRVLDGAAVGRALTDLVGLLEDPDRLGDLPR